MARPETLKRIEQDLAEGRLGKARDRLHGLVGRYPTDLSFRKKLGDVYQRLQYPERAGCYWYLEKHKTAEMQAACDAFVESNGGDPLRILSNLRFRLDPETLPSGHAREVLLSLRAQVPTFRYPFKRDQLKVGGPKTLREQVRDAAALVGCGLAVTIVLMVFCFGILTFVMFARGYDFHKP